jgi:predicted Zn finger-like uncharacterized protein
MLVVCKNCTASYAVPARKIGLNGREVRCAQCGVTFFVEANTEAYNASVELENLADDIQHNAALHHKPTHKVSNAISKNPRDSNNLVSVCITITLLIALLCTSGIVFYPQLSKYTALDKTYRLLGIYSTSNITLEEVKAEEILDDENEHLRIVADIHNNNTYKSYIPDIRISAKDHAGNEILNYTIKNSQHILSPNEKYHLNHILNNISPYASEITIDIGNQIELMLR